MGGEAGVGCSGETLRQIAKNAGFCTWRSLFVGRLLDMLLGAKRRPAAAFC